MFVLLFICLVLHGIVCYTFWGVLSIAFSCGRRGTAVAVDEELLCV